MLYKDKNTSRRKCFTQKKIVVSLAESVHRFYEPFVFPYISVSQKKADYR